jgi:predicted transcriptional regulator
MGIYFKNNARKYEKGMLVNKDFKFFLSVSKKNYSEKPPQSVMHTVGFKPRQLTVEETLQHAVNGYAFCYIFESPEKDGYLKIKFKEVERFKYTSVIFYDFDMMSVPMEEFIGAIPYKPTFAYPTYSNGENGEYRYRLVYAFDDVISTRYDFYDRYLKIGIANNFVREEKQKNIGGWDVRVVNQLYFGTKPTSSTYKSDYLYSASDFSEFIVDECEIEEMMKAGLKKKSRFSVGNIKGCESLSPEFMKDFSSMTSGDFMRKYSQQYFWDYVESLETPLITHESGMYSEFPDDYVQVFHKRRGKDFCRWNIGDNRKSKLYLTAQIMLHNNPSMTMENLLFNLKYEKSRFYCNSDGKLTNEVLVTTARNAFRNEFHIETSKHPSFRVNKKFWTEQGITAQQASRYIITQRKVDKELLPYIDSNKDLNENYKILINNGIKISKERLKRLVSKGYIKIIMGGSASAAHPLLSYCDNCDTNRILELIKANESITNQEIASILSISIATVKRYIKKMKGKLIDRIGNNRTGHWVILDYSQDIVEPHQDYSSISAMTEYERWEYDFTAERTIVEEKKPMTDDELRADMLNDGWTEQEVDDFFAIYAA